MKIKGVEIGDVVLIAPSESEDGRIGYGPRLVGHFGTAYIGGNAEDLRAASKFFADLAEAREKIERNPVSTCGCSCNSISKCDVGGSGW